MKFALYLPPPYHVARTCYGPVFVGPGMPDVKADIEQLAAEEKREANKIRETRSRLKHACQRLEGLANGGKEHVEELVEYVTSDVALGTELSRNNLVQYRAGWQRTKVADSPKMAPALKVPVNNAVIVRPDRFILKTCKDIKDFNQIKNLPL